MIGRRVSRNVCLALVIVGALLSSIAEAEQTYSIQLEPSWFGNLNEHDVGQSMCAPTAAINSFVFLQNAYPSIYGHALVPDTNGNGVTDYPDMVAAAQALSGPDFMKTSSGGTNVTYIFPGIQRWIEGDPALGIVGKQPGVTFYQEQRTTPPDFEFLYNALKAGSSVMLWLAYYDEFGYAFRSHVVTLTGLQWTDQNGDGILNVEEGATMADVNPFNGNLVVPGLFQSEAGGPLFTDQAVGTNIDGTIVHSVGITGAFVLGPIQAFVPVAVDIRPMSCPNPLNAKDKGVFPVAILGTKDLDVTQIDPASIKLAGVSPLRWSWEDVATPFEGLIKDAYDCHDLGIDGYLDLVLMFNMQEVIAALGNVNDPDVRMLSLEGKLRPEFGETPIIGNDVVVILKRAR